MKKSILRLLLASKFMYIINYQYINHLIKMKKIVFIIIPNGLNKLCLKLICIYIEHSFVRKFLFYFNPNSLCQMCYVKSFAAVIRTMKRNVSATIVAVVTSIHRV